MNELAQWLQQAEPFGGALACAVRTPEGGTAARSWAADYNAGSLENVLRCVADLFQVIQHNRIAPGRVRWVYGRAILHCERRADGTCLGIFTRRSEEVPGLDATELERMFVEFRAV